MSESSLRAAQRELRHLDKSLAGLIEAVRYFIAHVDAEFKDEKGEQGKRLAKQLNALEMAKDRARFSGLGVDFRTGKRTVTVPRTMKP